MTGASGAAPSTGPGGNPHPPSELSRTLGILGTLIWDRIWDRDVRRDPVEEWGGISYGLEALGVALPPGWVGRPLLKVGKDLEEAARSYLGSIPRMELGVGLRVGRGRARGGPTRGPTCSPQAVARIATSTPQVGPDTSHMGSTCQLLAGQALLWPIVRGWV